MSVDVGGENDASPITGMVTIGGTLHVVKPGAIYEIRLADEIDPQRKNPTIPNTQRRVVRLGSESEHVGRTLLTARKLFDPNYLRDEIECGEAISLSFAALKDLGGMAEISQQILEIQNKVISIGEFKPKPDGSLVLPSIENVEVLCRTFVQRADHTLQSLLAIVRLVYGDAAAKNWFETLAKKIEHQFGSKDSFSQFLSAILPFLRFVRDARNCVEHPRHDQRIVVSDFVLRPDGSINPPMIEVVHYRSAQPSISITRFMEDITNHISQLFELMIAYICANNMKSISGFDFQLIELPSEKRSEKHVRFSYGLATRDQTIPAG